MESLISVIHIVAALILIVIVLLQTGKGASMGAVFGGGSSHTLFGNRGAGNFLTKMTTGAAVIFMLTSLGISMLRSAQKTSTISIPVETSAKTTPTAKTSETKQVPVAKEATPSEKAPATDAKTEAGTETTKP